jgi:hypothetical protein
VPALAAKFTSHNQNKPMEGGSITPPIKSQAMRLALYLDSIQQTPNISGNNYREYVVNLSRQFQQLAFEERKDAKRLGRMRIRECGDLDAAASYLVPVPPKRIRLELAFQKRREKASRWPAETPACPRCRVRKYDIPKRSWPSQEMAEAVRLFLRDPLMVTYPCPIQSGFWHLGHRKTPKSSI